MEQKWPANYNTCLSVCRRISGNKQATNAAAGVLKKHWLDCLAVPVHFPLQERECYTYYIGATDGKKNMEGSEDKQCVLDTDFVNWIVIPVELHYERRQRDTSAVFLGLLLNNTPLCVGADEKKTDTGAELSSTIMRRRPAPIETQCCTLPSSWLALHKTKIPIKKIFTSPRGEKRVIAEGFRWNVWWRDYVTVVVVLPLHNVVHTFKWSRANPSSAVCYRNTWFPNTLGWSEALVQKVQKMTFFHFFPKHFFLDLDGKWHEKEGKIMRKKISQA